MRWRILRPTKGSYSLSLKQDLGLVILANSGKCEIVINLYREGVRALVLGLINSGNDDNLELKVVTVHQAPNTHAETMIHGLADGRASVEVKGLIQIKKPAQQVTDFLTERILLLSDRARAVAQPELEIEADEVRASHAATVAPLDKTELFYLMSRGISLKQAEGLMINGFMQKVAARIGDDKIRQQAKRYVKR